MLNISNRTLFFGLFLFSCGLMATGYFMQYVKGLEPCPLCITQRFFIVLAGAIALAAALHNPRRRGCMLYASGIALACVAGGSFSSRQLYLQSLPPDQAPACGPSLSFMLETFPLSKTLELLLRGDGNCAEVVARFLGLSIPGWTLVAFGVMAATALFVGVRAQRRPL